MDFRLFGGMYYFDADGYGSVAGPKARAELTLDNRVFNAMPDGMELTFGVQYQNDQAREGQTTALVELRMPFGAAPARKNNRIEKRMTSFVERDIDIIAAEGGAGTTPATVTINGQQYSQIGGTIDGNTANVNNALTTAGANSLVVFDGAAGNIASAGVITPLSGQALIGGGASVTATAGSLNATGTLPGSRPTLTQGIQVINRPNITLRNMDINTATNEGIFLGGAATTDALIEDVSAVTTDAGLDGISLFLAEDVTITDTHAEGTDAGLDIAGVDGLTLNNVTAVGNDGIYIDTSDNVNGTVDTTGSVTACNDAGGNINSTINLAGGGTCP